MIQLALLPAPVYSPVHLWGGLIFFVAERFLTHVPAFMFSLHFLHSQKLGCMHITFLVCTCMFPISSALPHFTCTCGLSFPLMPPCLPTRGGLFPVALYVGFCVCTASGMHVLMGTHGISFLHTHLRPSVPSEPVWYMRISNVSFTFPCRWEVCRGGTNTRA